jgi:RNA polymerase sigma-70 factor (ECF subfamily)
MPHPTPTEPPIDPALWHAYRDDLYRFVRSRVGDPVAAEDIVQDVLTRAYAGRHALRAASKLRTWLFQITQNTIVDYYRTRRPAVPLPPDLGTTEGPESGDAEQALAQCLAPLVRRLPARYREALEHTELEGRTQKAAAALLGLSISGAKSRVQRARKLLEAMLVACCRLEFDSRGRVMGYEREADCRGCASC